MTSPVPSTPRRPGTQANPSLNSLPTYSATSKARLQALYSDFSRQKSSNPASFSSAVDWWSATFQDVLTRGEQIDAPHALVLSVVPTLADRYRYEGVGKPLALSAVIADLLHARTLIPRADFISSSRSVLDPPGWSALGIASALVVTPLRWALATAGLVDAEQHESDADRWRRVQGEHVVLPLVRRAAEAVVARRYQVGSVAPTDDLYDIESFTAEFAGHVFEGSRLSDLDIKVLLRFLERDEKVLVMSNSVIKFLTPHSSPEITSTDTGLLELKRAVSNAQAQVDRLQAQIDKRTAEAGTAAKLGRKETALSHLRARRALQELLSKRLGALDTLHGTLVQVEAAAGNIQIMTTYATASETLRALLAHPALARDNVDATLDALAQANAAAGELDDAIRLGGPQVDLDEDEIAAELAALAEEESARIEGEKLRAQHEREREEARRALEGLPSTPADVPLRQGDKTRVTERA